MADSITPILVTISVRWEFLTGVNLQIREPVCTLANHDKIHIGPRERQSIIDSAERNLRLKFSMAGTQPAAGTSGSLQRRAWLSVGLDWADLSWIEAKAPRR